MKIGVSKIKFERNWSFENYFRIGVLKIIWKWKLWKLNLKNGVLKIKFEKKKWNLENYLEIGVLKIEFWKLEFWKLEFWKLNFWSIKNMTLGLWVVHGGVAMHDHVEWARGGRVGIGTE